MKILLLVALCLVVQIGSKKGKGDKHMESKCIKSSGADKVTVKAAYDKCSFTGEKLGSFALCMLKKKGIVTDSGTTNEEALRKKAGNSTKVEKIIKKCLGIPGSGLEKAGPLAGCVCELHKLKKGSKKPK